MLASESPLQRKEKAKCAIGMKNNQNAAYPTKAGGNIAKMLNNDKRLFLDNSDICTSLAQKNLVIYTSWIQEFLGPLCYS